jgi:hypothetical protein
LEPLDVRNDADPHDDTVASMILPSSSRTPSTDVEPRSASRNPKKGARRAIRGVPYTRCQALRQEREASANDQDQSR